ncbi:MAG TPA: hypothetical protein VMN39_09415 [Longimicrobiaceae bacterium]|nr:hypothetical protein [Longimicrobiaceae bacterium]
MSMKKRLAKGAAYAADPKLTFSAFNPKKAAFAKAASWATDRISPRRRVSKSAMAMKGIGAAAVALPIGLWLGRRFLGNEEHAPLPPRA